MARQGGEGEQDPAPEQADREQQLTLRAGSARSPPAAGAELQRERLEGREGAAARPRSCHVQQNPAINFLSPSAIWDGAGCERERGLTVGARQCPRQRTVSPLPITPTPRHCGLAVPAPAHTPPEVTPETPILSRARCGAIQGTAGRKTLRETQRPGGRAGARSGREAGEGDGRGFTYVIIRTCHFFKPLPFWEELEGGG